MRLWAEDSLVFSCDCPLGLDGEFCKHCVAAGLAWLDGDFSEHESKDLSSSFAYLEIARIYKQAGDDEKALEWAEEGAWVFPGGGHPDLRRFLADEYHDRGRHDEAMDLIWAGFAEESRHDGYKELKAHADRDGTWKRWRRKALDFVREEIARGKKESQGSYLSRPVDSSRLVEILLWEGNVEEAWREAKEGGCSDELWLNLAAQREEVYPEDSLAIYQERIEPLVNRTNNKAYRDAYELLIRVRELTRRLGREAEFEEYVELLRLEYTRKRNFIKLLDGMG